MRTVTIAAILVAFAAPAAAAETITSAYTDLDTQKDCVTYDAVGEEEGGDWADLVCSGYRGYPVMLFYGDARESLFYGFPPEGDDVPVWESFSAFNNAGPKIEWRIADDGRRAIPFATIHRRFVSASGDSDKTIEVLVVSKVAQVAEREGCAVGLVVATGNAGANEAARRIADESVRGFKCGTDERIVVEGKVPLPGFTRQEN